MPTITPTLDRPAAPHRRRILACFAAASLALSLVSCSSNSGSSSSNNGSSSSTPANSPSAPVNSASNSAADSASGQTGGSATPGPGSAGTVKNAQLIAGLKVNADLQTKVPAAWRNKEITVATSADSPPANFMASDGSTIVGWSPDFANAIAKILGLKFKVVNTGFDGIIPGVQAGKFDLAITGAGVFPEREKVIDFVTYPFLDGQTFMVRTDNNQSPKTLDVICGVKIAAVKGTTQSSELQDQMAVCQKAGKPAPEISTYPDLNSSTLALTSSRIDMVFADYSNIVYVASLSNGQVKHAGEILHPKGLVPQGIIIAKGQDPMREALLGAVNQMIHDGTYATLTKNWSLGLVDPLPDSTLAPAAGS